jgi:histidyl-tRNA synthetase
LLAGAGRDAALMAPPPKLVWLVGLGDEAMNQNLVLMQSLRAAGVACRMATGGSLKSQMRAANKAGAAWAVIRGDDELAQAVATVKDMATGEQRRLPLDQLAGALSA